MDRPRRNGILLRCTGCPWCFVRRDFY